MEQRNGRIVESPVEARQGFLGRPVLIVLVVSCTLPSSHFRSLAFLGTLGNRGSRSPSITHETLMTDESEEEPFIAREGLWSGLPEEIQHMLFKPCRFVARR
jgi:hypothetical protein